MQTKQEYQTLQGARINARFAKRGKEISARRLRINARHLDGYLVDYRNMGYVTEVKDQVSLSCSELRDIFRITIRSLVWIFSAGLLWLVLGLQHYRRYRGTTVQEHRPANILEWTELGGLLQKLWYLRLQRRLDGQRLRLRGQQRAAVDGHLPVHLSGEALLACSSSQK